MDDEQRFYHAEVEITIVDDWTGRPVNDSPTTIRVDFEQPDDPRTLLCRAALEYAVEVAQGAERYLMRLR